MQQDFSHVYINPEDEGWGFIADGKWNGMVKQVMTNEADIMVTCLKFLVRARVWHT